MKTDKELWEEILLKADAARASWTDLEKVGRIKQLLELDRLQSDRILNNMKTIKIEIPEGYEIDSIDKLSGEVKFKHSRGPAIERINTVADVLADHGINQEQFNEHCEGLEEDEKAYRIIKLLAKSLNDGWVRISEMSTNNF